MYRLPSFLPLYVLFFLLTSATTSHPLLISDPISAFPSLSIPSNLTTTAPLTADTMNLTALLQPHEQWRLVVTRGPPSSKPVLAAKSVYMAIATVVMTLSISRHPRAHRLPIGGVGYGFDLPDTERAVLEVWSPQQDNSDGGSAAAPAGGAEVGIGSGQLNDTQWQKHAITFAAAQLMQEIPRYISHTNGLVPRLSFALLNDAAVGKGTELLTGTISQATEEDIKHNPLVPTPSITTEYLNPLKPVNGVDAFFIAMALFARVVEERDPGAIIPSTSWRFVVGDTIGTAYGWHEDELAPTWKELVEAMMALLQMFMGDERRFKQGRAVIIREGRLIARVEILVKEQQQHVELGSLSVEK